MTLRAVIQVNPDGERNVTLTRDLETPTEDFLLTNPQWVNSVVIEGMIGVIGDENVIAHLLDAELKGIGVANPTINKEAVAALHQMLGVKSEVLH